MVIARGILFQMYSNEVIWQSYSQLERRTEVVPRVRKEKTMLTKETNNKDSLSLKMKAKLSRVLVPALMSKEVCLLNTW